MINLLWYLFDKWFTHGGTLSAIASETLSLIFEVLCGCAHCTLHPHLSLFYWGATQLERSQCLYCPLLTAFVFVSVPLLLRVPYLRKLPLLFSTEESISCIFSKAQLKNQFLLEAFSDRTCPLLCFPFSCSSLVLSHAVTAHNDIWSFVISL